MDMNFKIERRHIITTLSVFLCAVAMRALYVMLIAKSIGVNQFSDFLYMHQLATSLSNGNGFTINGVRIFNQSVGYPAFLSVLYSIFGSSITVALVANCLLGGISAGLVCVLVYVVFGNSNNTSRLSVNSIALFAGAIAIFYPDSWLYCPLVASENLLIPLLLGLVILNSFKFGDEKESLRVAILGGVGTGVIAALALSVKANLIFFCMFLAIQWMIARQRWVIRGICAAVVGIVLLIPWTIANYRASDGHIIPFASVSGTVLLDGTNPSAVGKPTNLYHLECEKYGNYNEIELNQLRFKKAVSYIKSDPAWYFKLVLRKIAYGLSPVRDFVYEHEGKYRLFNPIVSRWYPTAFNAFLIAGIILGFIAGRKQKRLILSSTSLVCGAILLQAIFCAYSRYRFPFLFALIPLVAWGYSCLVTKKA